MAFVLFVRDGKVVFKQSVKTPFEISAPSSGQVLQIGEGESAEMAGLQVRVFGGRDPGLAGPSQSGGPPNLPGFEIKGKLGEGGMGTVWLATQLGTNRQVAIKTLNTGNLSEEQRARFALEIEVTAQLDHPNIGRLFESQMGEGLSYYAMEFIDGSELEDFVDAKKPSDRQWLTIMVAVCRAVQYAHQKGIIHRDLKPGNIMVTQSTEPKVVDFGIAKLVEPDKADQPDSKLTTEGTHLGTPAYMSPEQIQANPALIDTRTDVYALGVILYEHIVGRHPFDLEGSSMQLFMQVLREDAPTPRSIKSSIDKDLEAVLIKAIARNPEERYAAAGELADDLQRYLANEPVLAKPQTAAYVMRKKLAKHKGKFAVAMLVILGFLAYAAVSFVMIRQERDRAQEAEKIAAQERDLAEQRFNSGRDFARSLIFGLDDKLEVGITAARSELVQHSRVYLEQLAKDAGDRPDVLEDIARAYVKVGEVEEQRGDLDGAMKSYRAGRKGFRELEKMDNVEDTASVQRGLADALLHLAEGSRAGNDFDKSRSYYKSAIKILKKLTKRDDDDDEAIDLLVEGYEGHGKLLSHTGDQDAAAKNFGKALSMRRKRFKAKPDDDSTLKLAKSEYSLGVLRLDQGRPAEALPHFQECLTLRKKLLEGNPENNAAKRRVAAGHRGVGFAYQAQGALASAEESFQTSFDIFAEQVRADPSNQGHRSKLVWAYVYLAEVQMMRNNFGTARKNLEEAVNIIAKMAYGSKSNTQLKRLLARTQNMLAMVNFREGRYNEATQYYTQARSTTEPLVKADSKDLYALDPHSTALMGLGQVAHAQGRHDDAWKLCEEAIAFKRRLLEGSPKDAAYQRALGQGLMVVGSISSARRLHFAAVKHYKEAEQLFRGLLGQDATNAEAKTSLVQSLVGRAKAQTFLAKSGAKADKVTNEAAACAAYKDAEDQLLAMSQSGGVPASLARDKSAVEKGLAMCD